MTPQKAFARVLREVRNRRGLSQEGLALDSGISRNYVSLLERGAHSVALNKLFLICHTLRVRPSNLLRRVEAHATKLPPRKSD